MLADKSCVFFFNRAYVPIASDNELHFNKKASNKLQMKNLFCIVDNCMNEVMKLKFLFLLKSRFEFFYRSSKMLNDQLDFFFVDFAMSVVIRYQDDVKIHNENVRKIITH